MNPARLIRQSTYFNEGKAEGLAEGDKKARLETARKLREKGFSAEKICELTGLSLDDVQELVG